MRKKDFLYGRSDISSSHSVTFSDLKLKYPMFCSCLISKYFPWRLIPQVPMDLAASVKYLVSQLHNKCQMINSSCNINIYFISFLSLISDFFLYDIISSELPSMYRTPGLLFLTLERVVSLPSPCSCWSRRW